MKKKKVAAFILSTAMLFSSIPGEVLAAEVAGIENTESGFFSEEENQESQGLETEEQNIEKQNAEAWEEYGFTDDPSEADTAWEAGEGQDISVLSTVGIEAKGTLTETISWLFYADGNLELSGTGALPAEQLKNREDELGNVMNKVTKITISDGITAIGRDNFYGCTTLISASIPQTVKTIGWNAFCDCSNLQTVTIAEGVTSIGMCAFQRCKSLSELEIPDSVKVMGSSVFAECESLTEVKVTVLEENNSDKYQYIFCGCKNLKKVTLSTGLKKISNSMFLNCKNLEEVVIPDGVTQIDSFGFASCDSLQKVSIPASVTSIGTTPFANCDKLETVYFGGTQAQWKQLGLPVGKATVYCDYDPNHAHVYEEEVIDQATCTTDGKAKMVCSLCGESYEKELPATGHKWDEGKVTKEATCTTAGEKTYTCETCGKIRKEDIPANGHTEKLLVTQEATCEETGTGIKYCTVCNKILEENVSIPATGHKIEIDEKVEPTCETAGKTQGAHCALCKKVFKAQEEIPATGHKWDEGKVTKEATCTTAGEKTYTCETCGKIRKEEIPAAGHKWDEGKVTKEATCTTAGEKTYICETCGKIRKEDIPAAGHKIVNDAAVAATCETAGKTAGSHCSVCGKVLEAQVEIPATGHSFSSWQTTKAATVHEPEVQIRTCTICKKQEERKNGTALQPTIKVTASSLRLKTKQKTTVLKISGLAAGDKIVSWKSTDTKVVKVSGKADGTSKVTAGKKKGKASIIVTLDSGLTKKIPVTVQTTTVKITKITSVPSKLSLKKKQSVTLKPVIAPLTSQEKVAYASSNPKVASVTTKGVIKAKKKGTAVITVKSGKKKKTCKVTVR